MKAFKGGAEIRLTKEDLEKALEYVLNDRLLGISMAEHQVDSVTLHPANKYVARLEISPRRNS